MAFPVLEEITVTSGGTTDGTSFAVNMPATVAANDLLLMLSVSDGRHSMYIDDDLWVPFFMANGSNVVSMVSFAKVAVGNEDGTTVTVNCTGSEQFCAQVYRIRQGTYGDIAGLAISQTSATSATPDPAPVTPYWGSADTFWIAYAVADNDDLATAYPASYTNGTTTESGANAGSSCSISTASRTNTASSENPGTFTIAASQAHGTGTIAIAPTGVSLAPGPIVDAVRHTAFGSDAATHNVVMPTNVAVGDLLVCQFVTDGNPTITTPDGWTNIITDVNGTALTQGIYAKMAAGTEDGTSVDFHTSANEEASALVLRVRTNTWKSVTASGMQAATAVSATTNIPDAPALTPAWGSANVLWLEVVATDGGTSRLEDGGTALRYNIRSSRSSTNAGACGAHMINQVVVNSTLNPSTVLLSASVATIAQTVGILVGPTTDVLGADTRPSISWLKAL